MIARREKGAAGAALLAAVLGCSAPAPTDTSPPAPEALIPAETASAPLSSPRAPPRFDPNACPTGNGAVAILASPRAPAPGGPLRFIAATSDPAAATLVVLGPGGDVVASSSEQRGGPPSWWIVEPPAAATGTYHAALVGGGGAPRACAAVEVVADEPRPSRPAWGPAWPVEAAWSPAMEDLYSAWIERLFDAPPGEQPSWPALHEVLRSPARNFLHDHLGAGEDDGGPGAPPIEPDCADFPYFLRAYFASKLGLPFGYATCTRGAGSPPVCGRLRSNLDASPSGSTIAARLSDFLRVTVADAVHSGNARAGAEDDATDYYPVRLDASSLRPGTVYADPYGHVLVLAGRVAQAEGASGVLLAVDGQPDGTIARRRFWRGNFLFALDPTLGSPGFKRFRPVFVERGAPRRLTSAEIAGAPGGGDFSLEQYQAGVEGFYDRVEDVLSPLPVDPERALVEAVVALEEQVRARVTSVANAEAFKAKAPKVIDMPEGAAIFETVGPWEDFSTPSRDLRLLVAIDVVRGFPERVERRPERYAAPPGQPASALGERLRARLAAELGARKFVYQRSDGSPAELALADLMARGEALEVAYNPNDCVEQRWGAPEGSDAASTCRRRAPPRQAARMQRSRAWFHERRRPARTG